MIVSSYVRHHTLRPEQLSDLITTVYHALSHLGQPMQTEVLTPAVSVRRSVHHDYVVCLDCGYRGKMGVVRLTYRDQKSPKQDALSHCRDCIRPLASRLSSKCP